MRIILDTDKKTITVPWNYQRKLDEMNKIIEDAGSDKKKEFVSYLTECWNAAMANTDKNLITAAKPKRKS